MLRIAVIALAHIVLTACSSRIEERNDNQQGFFEPSQLQKEAGIGPYAVKRGGTETLNSGVQFECTPIRVWDGDGPIWCAEGMKVRLAGIAAREIDETCREGHPCPAAGGVEARDALVGLVGVPIGTSSEGHVLVKGKALSCFSEGRALGDRTAAWCVSPTFGDLSCEMISRNAALRWDDYWGDHKCDS
jgi:endonuclease YncB( thermonuclease family)